MKKSIFLALTSTLLLFSCAKNDQEINKPIEEQKEFSITISGTAQMTPALTKATASESKITEAMAFVFRGSEDAAILDCAPFALNTSGATTTSKVTSEARWVFIVANKSVSVSAIKTLGDLKALTASLFENGDLTQKEDNLIMWGSNTIDRSAQLYTSSVVLRFAPARVSLKYTVSGANAADLTAHSLAVLNAQGTTRMLPAITAASSKADNVSLLPEAPQMDYFAGMSMESFAVKPASYTVATPLSKTAIDPSNVYTYYLFENDETHPTILTISGEFGGKTLYYPVVFSGTDSGANVSEFEPIKAGRQYDITVNIKNVLAGSSDPTQPSSSQAIEVTVIPADWETVIEWIKDFE